MSLQIALLVTPFVRRQEKLRRKTKRAMLEAGAETLAKAIETNISVPGPPASVPGEYPHIDTGDLQGHITTKVYTDSLAGVISEMDYSQSVEVKRPYIVRSFTERTQEIAASMIDAGKRASSSGG